MPADADSVWKGSGISFGAAIPDTSLLKSRKTSSATLHEPICPVGYPGYHYRTSCMPDWPSGISGRLLFLINFVTQEARRAWLLEVWGRSLGGFVFGHARIRPPNLVCKTVS